MLAASPNRESFSQRRSLAHPLKAGEADKGEFPIRPNAFSAA